MEVDRQNDTENAIDGEESVDAVTNGVEVNDADVFGTNGSQISSPQINGSHPNISPNDNCLLRIIFRDNETYDELHPLIGKCVRDALFLQKKPAIVAVDSNENSIKFIEITSDDSESIFMVDPLPMENTNQAEIPAYNSGTCEILNDECAASKEIDGDDDNKCRGMLNCWNCGGDHNMKDCKEKRDPAAIGRAKQMFNQKSKAERYHLDTEQKYCHLLPGKISDNLRQALGLRSRELPLYIYKMRLYGYPEGWLEEAKINHSGLSLFHSEVFL